MSVNIREKSDLWSRVDRSRADSCWPIAFVPSSGGYGQIRLAGKRFMAHVVAYELTHGPVPTGLVVDHTCHNTRCCNPGHLEAVTNGVNIARARAYRKYADHCPKGHEYTESNTYCAPGTDYRQCRTCRNDAAQRYRHRQADGLKGVNYMASKVACPHGHEYTFENTRRNKKGSRVCRACERARGYIPHNTSTRSTSA